MKALLTGATGFIGRHLVRRLASEGHEVHAVLRAGRPRAERTIGQRVIAHVHDGTTGGLIEIMEAARPDVVIHLASRFVAEHRPDDIEELVSSNLLFATQLVEAMAIHQIRSFINTGTSWQHYRDEVYNPVCLYAATKQAFEAVLRHYVESCGLRALTLKLFDTYGPGDRRGKLFSLLGQAARTGEPLEMSPGEQLLDLVYIDDVVDAFLLAADCLAETSGPAGQTYAVGSGRPVSLREVVRSYCEIAGVGLDVRWGSRPYRAREVMIPWSQGTPVPGWTAKISLREGIRRMVHADV